MKFLLLIVSVALSPSCKSGGRDQIPVSPNQSFVSEKAVNINNATAEELEELPGIGAERAKNIIDFRAKYGKFRRTENLILVRGMSDKKFRALRDLVRVE